MASERMSLGVVLERRASDNPWEDFVVRPVAVLPGATSDLNARTLSDGDGWRQYVAGMLDVELHHTETEDYRYNLANDPPAIYVVLREELDAPDGVVPFAVSASPFEAQTWLDADENLVEAVPMPPSVVAWVGAFVDRYHVDRPIHKRQRKPHDPRKGGDRPPRPVAAATRKESER